MIGVLATTTNRTWDEYTSELTSGHLSWTPVHSSDLFWKENVTRLNEKDHFYLKFVLVEPRQDENLDLMFYLL
jgi:hypothetical protein